MQHSASKRNSRLFIASKIKNSILHPSQLFFSLYQAIDCCRNADYDTGNRQHQRGCAGHGHSYSGLQLEAYQDSVTIPRCLKHAIREETDE